MRSSVTYPPREHPTVHNFVNLTGRVFGRLKVRHYVGKVDGKPSWMCECECGEKTVTPSSQLIRGRTQSCSCLMIERIREANTTHGRKGSMVYRIWSGMWNRCRNPNSKDYAKYGARGVTVCESWKSFQQFLADMGEPPATDSSIERINCNGNYEPGNCCWLPLSKQAHNRRSSVFFTAHGKTQVASLWDKEFGFFPGTVARRLKSGRPHNEVLKPINKNLSRQQLA